MFLFFLRAAAAAEFLADSAYLRSAHADELIGKQRLLSHISIKSRFMTRPGLQPCAPQLLSCWELRVFCRFSYFSAWSRFWLQQSNLMVEIVLNLCQIFFSCVEFQSCVLCGQIAVPWFFLQFQLCISVLNTFFSVQPDFPAKLIKIEFELK